jgi:hypothetical protein
MHDSIDALDLLEAEEASDRRALGTICETTSYTTDRTGLSDED